MENATLRRFLSHKLVPLGLLKNSFLAPEGKAGNFPLLMITLRSRKCSALLCDLVLHLQREIESISATNR